MRTGTGGGSRTGTGRRKAELLSLRFQQINFDQLPVFHPVNGKEVELRPNCLLVAESKSGKPRTIPMNPVVREASLGGIKVVATEVTHESAERSGTDTRLWLDEAMGAYQRDKFRMR